MTAMYGRLACSRRATPRLRCRNIANAQTLKSGTLSLVVPFAAGGPSDVAGRILAQGMQETLGQTVVVENPVGGGGTVGSLRVSRSTPDGSQFVLGNNGTHSWSQSLYKTPPYETLRDFTPLGLAVELPRVIIVPKDLPANTLQEFIAYVKANQDTHPVRLGRRRLRLACELHPAQRHAGRERHPRALSRSRPRDAGPDRRPRAVHLRLGLDLEAADRGRPRQGASPPPG